MSFTGLPPGDYSLGDRDRTPGRYRVIEQLNGKVEETLRQGLAIFFLSVAVSKQFRQLRAELFNK